LPGEKLIGVRVTLIRGPAGLLLWFAAGDSEGASVADGAG
jgi:hypothetical protein